MPKAINFRKGCLEGYRRTYSLVSVGGIRSGSANFDTKEMAALAIQQCPSSSDRVFGILFDVPTDEVPGYIEREHRYKPVYVQIYDYSTNSKILALRVIEQSDSEYKASCGNDDEYYQRVGQYYQGSLWHRKDILPMKNYMLSCAYAAYELGGNEYIKNYFDGTLLADGVTTLRSYVTTNDDPDIKNAINQLVVD
jgi:hypothetical protein